MFGQPLWHLKFTLVGLLCGLLLYTGSPDYALGAQAEAGHLDLRGWKASQEPLVPLVGQWSFCWGALVRPQDIQNNLDHCPEQLAVPGDWHWAPELKAEGGMGFGTYHLHVSLPADHPTLMGLLIPWVGGAYRVWVNQTLVVEQGRMGTNPGESSLEMRARKVLFLAEGDQLDLTVQVSNFHFAAGGLYHAWQLGDHQAVDQTIQGRLVGRMLQTLTLAFFCCLLLGLYFLRGRQRALLYLAGFAFFFAVVNFIGEGAPQEYLLPSIPWEIATKTTIFMGNFMLPALFLYFQEQFPEGLFSRLNYTLIIAVIATAFVCLLAPINLYFYVFPIIMLLNWVGVGGLLVSFYRLWRQGEPDMWVFAGGLSIWQMGLIWDVRVGLLNMADTWLSGGSLGAAVMLTLFSGYYFVQISRSDARLLNIQKELGTLANRMEDRVQYKLSFVEKVSHYLHPPLTKLLQAADGVLNARDYLLPAALSQQVQRAFHEGHTAQIMLDNLHDFKLLQANKLNLEIAPTDHRTIVQQVLQVVKGTCDKEVEFQYRPLDQAPQVWADPERLLQLLHVVIQSAVFHMVEGRVVIEERHLPEGKVQLVVTDNRTEFIPEWIDIIRQDELLEQGEFEIAGGLLFVRTLLDRFGGGLELRQARTRGAQVTVILAEVEKRDHPSTANQPPHLTPASPTANRASTGSIPQRAAFMPAENKQASRPRAILLDNHEDRRRLIAQQLQNDFELAHYFPQEDLFERIYHQPPEMILLATTTLNPKAFGYLRRIRRSYQGPVVLLMEFFTLREDIERALQGGADDVVSIPAKNSNLLPRLRAMLGSAPSEPHHPAWGNPLLAAKPAATPPPRLSGIEQILAGERDSLILVDGQGFILGHSYGALRLLGGALDNQEVVDILGLPVNAPERWFLEVQKKSVKGHWMRLTETAYWALFAHPLESSAGPLLLVNIYDPYQTPPQDSLEFFNKLEQALSKPLEQLSQALMPGSLSHRTEVAPDPEVQGSSEEAGRRHLVELMYTALRAYETATGSERDVLARESGLWSVYEESDGRTRTQTMDRYLSLSTLPKRPRVIQVTRTAEYVLKHYELSATDRLQLESLLKQVVVET